MLAQEATAGLRAHRRRAGHVLRRPGRDRRHLVHRREHQLHRVPVPGQLRRRGLLPAPLADQARSPAGVLQRHHPADRAVAVADAGGRGHRRRAHPVLRDRRVHRVRHGRVRHGQVPPRTREPGWRRRLADQHRGRGLHGAGRGAVRGGQVHRGRLADRDHLPGPGVRADPAQPGVPGRKAAILADPGQRASQPHPPNYSRRVVLLLVDGYDLATIAALRYAKSLRPSALRAIHFSLDSARADKLRQQWLDAGVRIPLDLADCPDRRLAHAAAQLASGEAAAAPART